MTKTGRTPPARVVQHIERLRTGALSVEKFFEALVGVRDDPKLKPAEREALLHLIATESYVLYLEALRGGPIDRARLHEEAARLKVERSAAIKREAHDDFSLELIRRDIGPKAPPG